MATSLTDLNAGLAARDTLAERLFGALNATLDLYAIYLGDRLGYYQELASGAALTSAELAARTATAERYAREWLEQQAVTGILDADDSANAATRRFRLPAGHAEVLTDAHSLSYLVPYSRLVIGSGLSLPAVL